MNAQNGTNRRILIVDDNREIHADFQMLLAKPARGDLDDIEAALFGAAERAPATLVYDVDSAFQGAEGFAMVTRARADGLPYAIAFVDMRMPPGWDGLTTIEHIFAADPEIQVVICTAYSEYSWEDIVKRFPGSDRLLILRKPFDSAEVCQLAAALTEKWHLARRAQVKRTQLEAMVREQTGELLRINNELTAEIERRAATEMALRESQSRYALAADGAQDGLWDWDIARDLVFLSARWRSMLGLAESSAAVPSRVWLDRVVPEDRAGLRAALHDHFEGKTAYLECEYRAMHADGQLRWFLCRGAAVRDAMGKARRAAGSQTDITDRKRAEQQLRLAASHDSLTGLPNRALILDRVGRCIRRSARHGHGTYAILFMDLDRFKVINDTLGHGAGDQLLRDFGQRIIECVRGHDIVARTPANVLARMGGDEFVLLVEDLRDPADALRIAQRVIDAIASPFHVGEREVSIGCSIGIALGDPAYTSPDDLLRDADLALYHAKGQGRNRFELFDRRIHAATLYRWALEAELRAAVGTGAFFVEYQPIVAIDTGRIHSVEALVRWRHPRLGTVPPLDFVPLAEETGLIVPIGLEVVAQACRDLRTWRATIPDLADLRVAVNLSPRQLQGGHLAGGLAAILAAHGVEARHVDLEITESVLMDAGPQTVSQLEALRAAGHRLHLDDFGTGYCSLSYLRKVRVDALKIDRSFVQGMDDNAMTESIVRIIHTLAERSGMDVVAEGVETAAQRERLQGYQCQFAQGYLFGRPMPADALAAAIAPPRLAAAR